jgi:hypothetical protein
LALDMGRGSANSLELKELARGLTLRSTRTSRMRGLRPRAGRRLVCIVRPLPTMRTIVIAALLSFSGCDYVAEKASSIVPRHEVNLVILSAQDIQLSEKITNLRSSDMLKVVGERAMVCVVLIDGVPMQDQGQMDKAFRNALGEAKLTVDVVLSDGTRVPLRKPVQGWNRSGRILPKGEMSACVSPDCDIHLRAGAVINTVEITSAPALVAKGVYWESERSPAEERQELLDAASKQQAQRPNPALNRTGRDVPSCLSTSARPAG